VKAKGRVVAEAKAKEVNSMEPDKEKGKERIPLGQVVFDELFLLFLASLVISFVLYNIWGLLDLLRVPLAQ